MQYIAMGLLLFILSLLMHPYNKENITKTLVIPAVGSIFFALWMWLM